jgi:tRNA threonylcarbamoyladenosine biosynthesis protein TsaB
VRILAADTALGACSVAVIDGARVLAHRFAAMERGHAEALAPMAKAAMQDAGSDFAALDRLAVTTGPGTFTGQRVGLAFMRALRLALKIPLTGVTTLEAMAAAAMAESGAVKAAAIHDARRAEAYLLLREGCANRLEPVVLGFAQALERIAAFGPCVLAGTGAPAAAQALGEGFTLCAIRQPDALWVARLAQALPAADAVPEPLYLRAPDAKLPPRQTGAMPVALLGPDRAGLPHLAALHAASFAAPWDRQALAELLAVPGSFAFHHPDGFVLARVAGGEAEILTLAVAPGARRRGLGRMLVIAAAKRSGELGAQALFLEVGVANRAALALYTGLGFVKVGMRKGYYDSPRVPQAHKESGDALVLKLRLPARFAHGKIALL